jgi:hypothetical protein
MTYVDAYCIQDSHGRKLRVLVGYPGGGDSRNGNGRPTPPGRSTHGRHVPDSTTQSGRRDMIGNSAAERKVAEGRRS